MPIKQTSPSLHSLSSNTPSSQLNVPSDTTFDDGSIHSHHHTHSYTHSSTPSIISVADSNVSGSHSHASTSNTQTSYPAPVTPISNDLPYALQGNVLPMATNNHPLHMHSEHLSISNYPSSLSSTMVPTLQYPPSHSQSYVPPTHSSYSTNNHHLHTHSSHTTSIGSDPHYAHAHHFPPSLDSTVTTASHLSQYLPPSYVPSTLSSYNGTHMMTPLVSPPFVSLNAPGQQLGPLVFGLDPFSL